MTDEKLARDPNDKFRRMIDEGAEIAGGAGFPRIALVITHLPSY